MTATSQPATKPTHAALIKELNERRRACHWTLQQVAARSGPHPHSVSRLFRGHNVGIHLLADVAEALGLDLVRPENTPDVVRPR